MTIFQTFDDYALRIGHSSKAIEEAMRHGDLVGAVHASIENLKGYATGAQYSADISEKLSMIAEIASKYIPFSAFEKSSLHILQSLSSAQIIAGIGIGISALTIIANSISIHRQTEILSCIKDHRINLKNVNPNHFKNALPDHLNDEIESLGGLASINTDRKLAEIMVDKIQDYASRKRVYHMVAVAGAVVSLVASIGVFVAFPPLVLIGLMVVGLSLVIASAVIHKAWVENPKSGFDLKLLVPEFIQNKLKTSKPDVELSTLPAY